MLLYAVTIFLGAFLLFQVQPLIGKFILPWFGGTAAVWTTALLFFQTFLLVGYAYAHGVAAWLRPRGQGALHLGLLALSLVMLPIAPSASWKPEVGDDPTVRILLLLTLSIGGPYVMLSATGPLLQSWFARANPGRSPYRLYALSNAASLIALLSYPVLFERVLRLPAQTWLWSGAYVAFVALCGALAWLQLRGRSGEAAPAARGGARGSPAAAPATAGGGGRASARQRRRERRRQAAQTGPAGAAAAPVVAIGRTPRPLDIALWLILPAIASAMLLATTNRLTQDIAVVPFLWLLPLSVYLVSFILTFDSDRWYERNGYTVALAALLLATALVIGRPLDLKLLPQILLFTSVLLFVAMSCHGELVALRPGAHHLTLFYLMVAAGGALGGLLVAVVAPLLLDGLWEYHAGIVLTALVLAVAIGRDHIPPALHPTASGARRAFAGAGVLLAVLFLVVVVRMLASDVQRSREDAVVLTRNFYGALRILEAGSDEQSRRLEMVHGRITHGVQFTSDERRTWPTSYYAPASGAGLALTEHPRRGNGEPLRVGVVGLGTGTLATYAKGGDTVRFYEINPTVEELARARFTYLADATARGATVDVLLGDARVVLERQQERNDLQRFDVLVLDAFNSDAIPVHLLTAEAFRAYRAHLAPGGVLAVHVSNLYLDLTPVVRALAAEQGWSAHFVVAEQDLDRGISYSEWVLATSNDAFVARPAVGQAIRPWSADARSPLRWTDDFTNLLRVLK